MDKAPNKPKKSLISWIKGIIFRKQSAMKGCGIMEMCVTAEISEHNGYKYLIVGDKSFAKQLIKHGIKVDTSYVRKGDLAGIGFSYKEQKWYGWSLANKNHLVGFGIGDKLGIENPAVGGDIAIGFECKTLDDCLNCAIAVVNKSSFPLIYEEEFDEFA